MIAGYTLKDLFYLASKKHINMKVRNRLKRRYFLLVCLLTMIGLVISGCDGKDMRRINKTLEEAKELNEISNLGLEYLELSGISGEQARKDYNNDQPELAGTDDGNVYGYFFRYPDKGGEIRLTQIRIINGDYHVFGIRLGDEIDSASDVLKERGYKETKPTTTNKDTSTKAFKKYDVIIQLETEAGKQTIDVITLLTDVH